MAEDVVSLTNGSLDGGTLAALLEASVAINSTLDLEDALQAIAQSAAGVLDAQASSVLLLDRTRSKLMFKAAVGEIAT